MGSVTVLRTSGSRWEGGRPAPERRPPRAPRTVVFCVDSVIHNQFWQQSVRYIRQSDPQEHRLAQQMLPAWPDLVVGGDGRSGPGAPVAELGPGGDPGRPKT